MSRFQNYYRNIPQYYSLPNCLYEGDDFCVRGRSITKSARYHFNQQFEEYAPSTAPRYKRAHTLNGKNATYRQLSGMPHGEKQINPNGRNMRCVWRVSYEPSHEAHFAMYPSRLVETPVRAGSPDGGVVLDPFMGGGTTAVVARRLGRRFVGFEPNAEYNLRKTCRFSLAVKRAKSQRDRPTSPIVGICDHFWHLVTHWSQIGSFRGLWCYVVHI